MHITLPQTRARIIRWGQAALVGAASVALFACAGGNNGPNTQEGPATDANGQPIIPAGDIAIAGQEFAHSVMDLPQVAGATTPPLVQFSGVTSAINGPVDTGPYTNLFRDRLLLLTRLKLRFVERQLPPLTSHKIKSKKDLPPPMMVDTNADYQVMAQLRGNFDSDTYLVDIQFLDLHSNTPLFDGLYRIRKEAELTPTAEAPDTGAPTGPLESTAPNGPAEPVTPINLNTPPPTPGSGIP